MPLESKGPERQAEEVCSDQQRGCHAKIVPALHRGRWRKNPGADCREKVELVLGGEVEIRCRTVARLVQKRHHVPQPWKRDCGRDPKCTADRDEEGNRSRLFLEREVQERSTHRRQEQSGKIRSDQKWR